MKKQFNLEFPCREVLKTSWNTCNSSWKSFASHIKADKMLKIVTILKTETVKLTSNHVPLYTHDKWQ